MKIILLAILVASSAMASEINVKVSGMVCSLCAQGIQKKFGALPEVSGLDVNLDAKMVHIKTKDGQTVKDSVIQETIKDAGYSVVSIERK